MPRDAVAGLFSVMSSSGKKARQALAQNGFGVAADLPHQVGGRLDAVDEARGLADHDRPAVRVTRPRGLAELGAHLRAPQAQLVLPPDPLLDEPVPAYPHVGPGPDLAIGHVRDL